MGVLGSLSLIVSSSSGVFSSSVTVGTGGAESLSIIEIVSLEGTPSAYAEEALTEKTMLSFSGPSTSASSLAVNSTLTE
jgi:hypothetical protein